MKERPILFSAPMVRAILAGTKTQTRRICKNRIASNGYAFDKSTGHVSCYMDELPPSTDLMQVKHDGFTGWWYDGWDQFCPNGQPGDRLWVRERGVIDRSERRFFAYHATPGVFKEATTGCVDERCAGQTQEKVGPGWKAVPSIHMPRWASRITLEIIGVRVERLQEISENDATAEGVTLGAFSGGDNRDARRAYHALWEQINGAGSWAVNPWVWVIEFKRV